MEYLWYLVLVLFLGALGWYVWPKKINGLWHFRSDLIMFITLMIKGQLPKAAQRDATAAVVLHFASIVPVAYLAFSSYNFFFDVFEIHNLALACTLSLAILSAVITSKAADISLDFLTNGRKWRVWSGSSRLATLSIGVIYFAVMGAEFFGDLNGMRAFSSNWVEKKSGLLVTIEQKESEILSIQKKEVQALEKKKEKYEDLTAEATKDEKWRWQTKADGVSKALAVLTASHVTKLEKKLSAHQVLLDKHQSKVESRTQLMFGGSIIAMLLLTFSSLFVHHSVNKLTDQFELNAEFATRSGIFYEPSLSVNIFKLAHTISIEALEQNLKLEKANQDHNFQKQFASLNKPERHDHDD